MFPVLFRISDYSIHAYGFFIALGYLSCLAVLFSLARAKNVSASPLLDLALLAVLSGVLGARLLFIAINFEYYIQFPREALYVWKGGLVFYGGLLFALPCCALYIRFRRLPFWETLDMLAPALAIGHAFGRIGCLGAGCCHGAASNMPWAVRLNSDLVDPILRNVPVHPTQIYESAALFALAGILVRVVLKRHARAGMATLVYFSGYAVIRGIIETFRGDQIRGFVFGGGLSTSQFISILLLLAAALLWRRLRRVH